jgi:hypothetical protein
MIKIALIAFSAIFANIVSAQTGFSLLKGTVFTPEGRSFQGAKVIVTRVDVDAKQQKKSRKEGISDSQGEFAFRLDIGPARYHVTVDATGFAKQERDVSISNDERTDVSIVLKK